MGKTVLVDAQFGIAQILRPFDAFEDVYQGKDIVDNPILFTQGGEALDDSAGKPGYSPVLVKGLSVPLGSRVIAWLPIVAATYDSTEFAGYRYAFAWRLRSTFDFRQSRGTYHYPRQGAGFPDMTTPSNPSRAIKAAVWDAAVYAQTEPAVTGASFFGATNRASVVLHPLDVIVDPGALGLPLLPDGSSGEIQQGLGEQPAEPGLLRPSYLPYEVSVLGDELIVLCWRAQTGPAGTAKPNWDFDTVDSDFSIRLGQGGTTASQLQHPNIGIYIFMGNAP